jgi:nucleotide-binding universal stress UspA family protein
VERETSGDFDRTAIVHRLANAITGQGRLDLVVDIFAVVIGLFRFQLDRAGGQIVQRFKNILYFADGAENGGSSLERAVELATSNGARLTVIDVLGKTDAPSGVEQRLGLDLNQLLRERLEEALANMIEPFVDADTLIYTRVESGSPFVEVIRAVLRNGYDLLIKAARPPEGYAERFLGSTDMHLLRKCPCPVWIDQPTAVRPYRQLLAAVDPMAAQDESCDEMVMDLATSLARREAAHLAVLHAWRLQGESMLREGRGSVSKEKLDSLLEESKQGHVERLDKLLARYGRKCGDPEVHLIKGEAAPLIRELSESLQVDLIVMGTVGRTGIPGFIIGNTAEDVLQTTRASVLAVKPRGFVSPIAG